MDDLYRIDGEGWMAAGEPPTDWLKPVEPNAYLRVDRAQNVFSTSCALEDGLYAVVKVHKHD